MKTRKLYRSRTDSRISGVCGGIADHLDTDPVIIRLAFIGLTLIAPPAGIIGYLACWLIIPEEPPAHPAGGEPAPSGPDPGPHPGPEDARPARDTSPAGSGDADRGGDGTVVAGAILIAVGLFFLMLNFGLFDWGLFRFWRWRTVWPLIVIFLGAAIVLRSLRPAGRPGED